jgi:hypothetical protein
MNHFPSISLLLNMILLFSLANFWFKAEFSFLSLLTKARVYFFLSIVQLDALFFLPVSTLGFDLAIISLEL